MGDDIASAINFENKEYLKLKESDNGEYKDLIGGILVEGEDIIHTYKTGRDGLVFTDRRLIAINVQGLTGKKKAITVLPYEKIQAFEVQTAGVIDSESELYLWFSEIGKVKFEFTARTDVSMICRCISNCLHRRGGAGAPR